MSKLSYIFTTLLGAVPAGFGFYVVVQNILARSNTLGGLMLTINIIIGVCMLLVALTPIIVMVAYKDQRLALAMAGGGAVLGGAAGAKKKGADADGFGDAIPDDFDADEAAAAGGEDGDGDYEDIDADAEAYDDSEFEDFNIDDEK